MTVYYSTVSSNLRIDASSIGKWECYAGVFVIDQSQSFCSHINPITTTWNMVQVQMRNSRIGDFLLIVNDLSECNIRVLGCGPVTRVLCERTLVKVRRLVLTLCSHFTIHEYRATSTCKYNIGRSKTGLLGSAESAGLLPPLPGLVRDRFECIRY